MLEILIDVNLLGCDEVINRRRACYFALQGFEYVLRIVVSIDRTGRAMWLGDVVGGWPVLTKRFTCGMKEERNTRKGNWLVGVLRQ